MSTMCCDSVVCIVKWNESVNDENYFLNAKNLHDFNAFLMKSVHFLCSFQFIYYAKKKKYQNAQPELWLINFSNYIIIIKTKRGE